MVHIPSSYAFDFWLQDPTSNKVEVDCLMPNGLLIVLETNRFATLQDIKEELWEKAAKLPLYHLLRDASTYIFSCVSAMAEVQDLRDETRRICDVRPFCAVLKLIDIKEEDDENEINFKISSLLGKGIHAFQASKNPEVNEFRSKMKLVGLEVAQTRKRKSWREKLSYHYPPRLAPTANIPPNCLPRLRDGKIVLIARIANTENAFKFNVPFNQTPMQLLASVVAKKALTLNSHGDRPEGFVLKMCGQEEYLVGEYPLIQFLYIQECLSRDLFPELVLLTVDAVPVMAENIYQNVSELKQQPFSTLSMRKAKTKSISSWSIDDLFSVEIANICRLNTDVNRTVEVGVQAGLFHGGKPLCETLKIGERVVRDGAAEINEEIQFDIQVCNLPRNARLCLAVYEVSKTAKGMKARKLKESKQEMFMNPLAWVNTTVYDFRCQLLSGCVTLHMWTYAEDSQSEDMLQYLATVVANTNTEHATALTLNFRRYHQDQSVVYPGVDTIVEYARAHAEPPPISARSTHDVMKYLEAVRQQAESDPLHDMHEQDMKELWALRYEAQRYVPSLLPKLLDSVEWNDHKQVAEAISLVQNWPDLPVEKALELLDYAYADQYVRSFAVRCLQAVTDEELSLYLLQLVQAIKHESYLLSDLVQFLLLRALNNRRIGHFLFWHLRSEMCFPYVSVRFGLILEAYCRGSLEHMASLSRQLDCLNILQQTSEALRQKKEREKARVWLVEHLADPHIGEALTDVVSPLEPRFRLKGVKVEKCRVMDSKMRPLYLVMENMDPLGDDVYIIFKSGDDLRQDMLALQMIKIMDMLWKNEGLDLRMNPYGCVSTDHRVGLIEVVLEAETIANIQKEKGMFTATSAFSKGSLLAWLRDYNQEENQLLKAIEEFTLSCAGYCVATYVLGVADRHSDNIMVKKSGQLFHIDFGHILGHFKEKFGFRRERVPFVLTHDFVHVINKGQKDKKEALEFQIFQNHCEKAFLILRRHGGLILSLFAMMISTGLPELSSEKDLNYLRETLVLDLTEQDAIIHFRNKFCEALANSWKTSLNWASHNLAKNNKTY